MLKKILRKGFKIIYWTSFVWLLIAYYFGYRSLIGNIDLLLGFINLFLYGLVYTIKKVKYNNLFNAYIELFWNLKKVHTVRYEAYFNGTNEDIEKYSKLVDEGADTIFEYSNLLLEDKYASKRQKNRVRYIIVQTKGLKQNIQPPL